ncbi:hypothetical protein BDV09DRAFT_190833 [Aspergillus tetrazonus]
MTPPLVPPAQPARLEHFRSLGWLPPNFKPKTLEEITYNRYCIQLNKDYVDYLLLEDQAIYINFFNWMYRTSRKRLLQLYNEYWRRLYQYFSLFARRRVNDNFLEHVLPAKRKIPRQTKNKNTLDVDVFCKCKRSQTFQSNLPKYVSVDNLPASVCYRDIKLFYLKDPDSKRDVLCTIIKFRNLKGRPEDADGTKFFMHGDYQLAYCPINQIILLAFCDDAFFNTKLTPELIWQLQLGQDARFKDNIGYYNYRNFTSQERQRVLGQSGNTEGLLRVAGSMLRKWDPLAPSNLTDAQKDSIHQNPRVLELRQEKRKLIEEIYEGVKKELSQLRKSLANNTRETAQKEYFHTAPVLEVDRQINSGDEDWEEPTPDYVFSERARLVENFYGPEAENFDEDKLLARRIQVTKDMVALSQLCEPNRRGN